MMGFAEVRGMPLECIPSTQEFLDRFLPMARRTFLEDGYHDPLLFLHLDEYEGLPAMFIMPVNTQTLGTKNHRLAGVCRASLLKSAAVGSPLVVFVTEAWTSQVMPGVPMEEHVLPSELPENERGEDLVVTVYENYGRSQRLMKASITRDADGKPSLGEWEEHSGGLGGKMFITDEEREHIVPLSLFTAPVDSLAGPPPCPN